MKKYILPLLIFNLIPFQNISACSGFYIAKDSIVYGGKNTDLENGNSKIWFTPSTDTTFGYVSFGFDIPYVNDGMNIKGLVVYHFGGRHKKIKKSIGKPIYNGDLSTLIFAKCTSVDDVKKLLRKYNLGLFYNGMIMFSDKFGNSMIVEGDTIIEKKYFYQICTNVYQSEYNETNIPCWRYNTAKRQILSTTNFTDDFCKSVLDSVHQEFTQYSIVYDIKQLKLSVYLFKDFNNPVTFDLKSELAKGKRFIDLQTFFPKNKEYQRIFLKRQSPQNNIFILLFLIICGLLFLLTIILWPSAHLLKIEESKEKNEKRPKPGLPKIWSFTICILLSVYLIVLINFKQAFQLGLPQRIDNFPLFLKLIAHIPLLVLIMTVPLIIMNYKILRQPNQTIYFKWHFTINTISYLVLLGLFIYWGFVKLYI